MNKFAATLKLLADANVRFVVIGGYAAMLQGSVILTQDLDICYERTPENLARLASALAPIHPRLRGLPDEIPFALDVRALAQGMNFTLQTDLIDLDLLGEISGAGQFPDVVRDAETVEVYGSSYLVASLETLIKSKLAAARPKDRNALPELEALKEIKSRKPK
jgi:predicted nucleotidyltransferase